MKVRVSTIPFTGLKIDASFPLEPLNQRIKQGSRGNDILFTTIPSADLTLSKAFGGAEVKGVVTAKCKQLCSTCGTDCEHEVVADVSWMLQSNTEAIAAPDDVIEDPGVLTYDGDHVDLEEPLQEALILNLSPFWHPPRSAKGVCELCSKDCSKNTWDDNVETEKRGVMQLGSILEGALKKHKN